MDTIVLSRNTVVTVGPPTEFSLAYGLAGSLSSFLSRYPAVSRAFLVQFRYPPGHDPSVGDAPCLTCVVELKGDPANDIFNEISRASQPVVDGQLGPWRFLDFFKYSDSVSTAVERAAAPFYVKA